MREDQVMKKKSFFNFVLYGVLMVAFSAFLLRLLLPATSPAQTDGITKTEIFLLGTVDPDDRKHIWALPSETGADISRRLAAKYPRKSIDGVTFYQVHSWRDTAHLAIEAQAQQGVLLVNLINQLERLKEFGPDRKLTRRVTALEKRITRMSDAGHP